MEVPRRAPIVKNRDAQDKQWHKFRLHIPPRAIEPVTRKPKIVLVNPEQAIVKEIVGI
jgi:hypothetical protein